MIRKDATEVIPVRDPLPVALEPMVTLATSVLANMQTKLGCVWCVGSAWPCERVVLAAHDLAGAGHAPQDRQDWRR